MYDAEIPGTEISYPNVAQKLALVIKNTLQLKAYRDRGNFALNVWRFFLTSGSTYLSQVDIFLISFLISSQSVIATASYLNEKK